MFIEFDYPAPPRDGDPLECQTWARLTWRADALELTRVWDRAAGSMRDSIFVPLFPLAQWIVSNWWALFYESCPVESLPGPGGPMTADLLEWLHRHCVRVSLPGYASPFACIYSQGRASAIVMRADPHRRYERTPVEFTESERSEVSLDPDDVRAGLAKIVDSVLTRLDGSTDERAMALQADWRAICTASAQEAEFCRAAGRLGMDPYGADSWPDGILEWFERSSPGVLDRAFVTDLLEVPDPPSLKPLHHDALSRIVEDLRLGAAGRRFGPTMAGRTAYEEGYALATWLRSQLDVSDTEHLESLEDAASLACGVPIREEAVPIPGGRVLAVVGWERAPVMASRASVSSEATRFLLSRALYMALQGTHDGPRLLTDARTWDQRASRAFGAELLAPRVGVMQRFAEEEARVGQDEAEAVVADHFRVTPMVIRHQRENYRL